MFSKVNMPRSLPYLPPDTGQVVLFLKYGPRTKHSTQVLQTVAMVTRWQLSGGVKVTQLGNSEDVEGEMVAAAGPSGQAS